MSEWVSEALLNPFYLPFEFFPSQPALSEDNGHLEINEMSVTTPFVPMFGHKEAYFIHILTQFVNWNKKRYSCLINEGSNSLSQLAHSPSHYRNHLVLAWSLACLLPHRLTPAGSCAILTQTCQIPCAKLYAKIWRSLYACVKVFARSLIIGCDRCGTGQYYYSIHYACSQILWPTEKWGSSVTQDVITVENRRQ